MHISGGLMKQIYGYHCFTLHTITYTHCVSHKNALVTSCKVRYLRYLPSLNHNWKFLFPNKKVLIKLQILKKKNLHAFPWIMHYHGWEMMGVLGDLCAYYFRLNWAKQAQGTRRSKLMMKCAWPGTINPVIRSPVHYI